MPVTLHYIALPTYMNIIASAAASHTIMMMVMMMILVLLFLFIGAAPHTCTHKML